MSAAYVFLAWPWRWLARWRWSDHVCECRQCAFVVHAELPPALLCEVGFQLGKKAHP